MAAKTHSDVAAMVLAAGRSVRMGEPKLFMRIGRMTLIERVLTNVEESRVNEIILVTGKDSRRIAKLVRDDSRIKVIQNANYRQGLSSSIRAGLTVLTHADAAILVHADQPFADSALLDRMIRAYEKDRCQIVAWTWRNEFRPPVLFDRKLWPEILKVQGDHGAKEVIERHRKEIHPLKARSEVYFLDVDKPEDIVKAARLLKRSRVRKTKGIAEKSLISISDSVAVSVLL